MRSAIRPTRWRRLLAAVAIKATTGKQGDSLTNRPCLGFVDEESHSKRTSTRQQLGE